MRVVKTVVLYKVRVVLGLGDPRNRNLIDLISVNPLEWGLRGEWTRTRVGGTGWIPKGAPSSDFGFGKVFGPDSI
jgi:hypothetical protein